MTKRKKRLEKGIDSLKEQIKLHETKKEMAEEEGKFERVGYYAKELASFEEALKDRESKLNRKK
jgi:hypothetical protein